MVKVIIVNGMPEAGKTTFEDECRKILSKNNYNTVIKSSVDWVKDIASYCGWDGTKTDENRKFLSNLKAALTEWNDAVLNNLIEFVDTFHYSGLDFVIFIDIREPKEIEKAVKAFNAISIIVRRPQIECNTYDNLSDMNVFKYDYDFTVWNDSNIEQLTLETQKFVDKAIINNKNNIYNPEENYNE